MSPTEFFCRDGSKKYIYKRKSVIVVSQLNMTEHMKEIYQSTKINLFKKKEMFSDQFQCIQFFVAALFAKSIA